MFLVLLVEMHLIMAAAAARTGRKTDREADSSFWSTLGLQQSILKNKSIFALPKRTLATQLSLMAAIDWLWLKGRCGVIEALLEKKKKSQLLEKIRISLSSPICSDFNSHNPDYESCFWLSVNGCSIAVLWGFSGWKVMHHLRKHC